MSELVVVFILCAGAAVAVVSHARTLVGSTAQRRELDRLLAAVQRACSELLSRETRLIAALLGVLGVALCLPQLLWGIHQPRGGARLVAGALALALGGLSGVAVARLAHWAAARATARALAELRAEPGSAASAVFRGSLLLALAVDACSSLLCCIAFLGHHRFASWVLQLSPAAALQEAIRGAPVLALGAAGAALVFQIGGSTFQTAAAAQSAAAGEQRSSSKRPSLLDEEHNPALVAELVGAHAGGLVSRSADVFAALMLANAALLGLSGSVVAANPALPEQTALALIGLPLLVRATGLLGAAVAASSVRLGSRLPPPRAFTAVAASQALIAATGLLGAAFWLLGTPLYLRGFAAGMLGVLASLACHGLLLARPQASTPASSRERPAASAMSVARALGLGLERAWAPLLIAVASLAVAHALGLGSGLAHGGAYGVLLAVAGMAGSAALHLCCSAFASITATVRRLGALRRASYDLATRVRASELEQAGLMLGNVGDIQGILCATAAALLGALTLPSLALPSPASFSLASLASGAALEPGAGSGALASAAQPLALLGAVLGLASLSFHVGGVLQHASRAAKVVDEQLCSEGAVPDDAELDAQAPTRYRDSVVRAGRAATAALLPLTAAALLAPMALAMVLRLSFGLDGSRLAAHVLTAVASISVLTGGCAVLVARGALIALGPVRLTPGALAANTRQAGCGAAEFVQQLLGRSIGPAALLGLKATVVSALVILPLLNPSVP